MVFSYSASGDKAQEIVREVEALGHRSVAIKADQAKMSEVADLVRQAHDTFGRLDTPVNSAGVFVTGGVGDPKADIAAFDRQIDINVKGVAAAVRAAVPQMADGGQIVSIGTTGAVHIPFHVRRTTSQQRLQWAPIRGWSRHLSPRNITVNLVQPGAIDTDTNPANNPFADTLKGLAALGRYGKPEDIAAAVAFLAGPDASYITAATLNVDGGQTA